MPVLSNPRHERFAQALAEGNSASEAYTMAGYRPNDGNAIRLKGNERIKARVAALQNQAVARCLITVEQLTEELETARVKAMADRRGAAAAVAAIMAKAKLHGLLVDRAENTNSNYEISDQPMTGDEWAAEYSK